MSKKLKYFGTTATVMGKSLGDDAKTVDSSTYEETMRTYHGYETGRADIVLFDAQTRGRGARSSRKVAWEMATSQPNLRRLRREAAGDKPAVNPRRQGHNP